MDKFEEVLTNVMDRFLTLQRWRGTINSPENPTGIFPVILALDVGLRRLRSAERTHPLYELIREIRFAFEARAYQVLLRAAITWRDAPPASLETPPLTAAGVVVKPSCVPSAEQPEYIDMYRAGRRLPGHYGANQ